MIQKTIRSLLLASFVTVSLEASKIVVVNATKILAESLHGKALQAMMSKEEAKLAAPLKTEQENLEKNEKELVQMQQDLESKAKSLQEKASLLSSDAKESLTKEIEDLAMKFEEKKRSFERRAQKLQMDAQKTQQKLAEKYQGEMQKIDVLVKKIVGDLAKKHGWSIVLLEESVLYAAESVTDIVINELNEQLKKEEAAKKVSTNK